MIGKALALFALVASVHSGAVYQSSYPVGSATYVHDSPHVGLQSEQTVRGSFGSSISHQQKAIDSAFSSVRKTDTRITNPALVAAAPVYQQAYAAPAYATQTYAAPAYAAHTYAAPAAYAAHAAPVYQQTYAAPAAYAAHAAPVYQQAYAAPVQAAYATKTVSAAPVAYAAAPAVAKVASPLLGVQYSAVSPAVATLNFNGYGISYGY